MLAIATSYSLQILTDEFIQNAIPKTNTVYDLEKWMSPANLSLGNTMVSCIGLFQNETSKLQITNNEYLNYTYSQWKGFIHF